MKRLTDKNEFGDYVGSNLLDDECLCRGLSFDETNEMTECFNKLGQLEDIEEEIGVDLITFLKEMNHLIKNSSQTTGYTTSGKKITTDYGYVEGFLKQLKEALE